MIAATPDPSVPSRVFVTGRHVYNSFRLKCLYYLRLELVKAIAPTPDSLNGCGRNRKRAIIESLTGMAHVQCVAGDVGAAAEATVELMRQGVEWIQGGVLVQTDLLRQEIAARWVRYPQVAIEPFFYGMPDLFKRVAGKSAFGGWSYVVAGIKPGRKATFAEKMRAVFHSWLLEYVQGVWPTYACMVSGPGQDDPFDVSLYKLQLLDLVEEELPETMLQNNGFYHLTSACRQCPWVQSCTSGASAERDLSLIPSLRRAQKKALLRQGVSTVEDAARMDIRTLSAEWGVGVAGLQRIKDKAKALSAVSANVKAAPVIPGRPNTAGGLTPALSAKRPACRDADVTDLVY